MHAMNLNDMFASPPTQYRPMMQWSWNGWMTPDRIREQLQQFAEQKCGGVFIYPRPGFEQAYLSEQWFELWRLAAAECQRLGLECHIYDEFTCPAGQAGGHTLARNPMVASQVLRAVRVHEGQQKPQGEVLACFEERAEGVHRVVPGALGKASPAQPVVTLVLQRASDVNSRTPHADLTRREATDAFIASTHETYRKYARESFGRECRFVFSDEPQLKPEDGLIFSRHLVNEFHRDHGYDLLERLGALCFDELDTPAVRFDYYHTLNRLFVQNFMKPMHDWCQENGLLFTGHLMESATLDPTHQPSLMAALRYMHAPGTDLLAFQFHPTTPRENAPWYLFQLMIRSVGRQLGRQWLMCESCGANGYGYDVAQFKPLEDFLLALGVNVLDPHLTHQTLVGDRKYEWPQTLSDHSPWWPEYHLQADHTARVNAVLSQGREAADILVFLPTTTAWMKHQPAVFRPADKPDPLAGISADLAELTLGLYGRQVAFDFGDELMLPELGGSAAGRLVVGECRYSTVVLPASMENITTCALRQMKTFLASGGRVLALCAPPRFVDGRPSVAAEELAQEHPTQWQHVTSVAELAEICRRISPPPITSGDGAALPEGLVWRVVQLAGGEQLAFLCNPWSIPLSTSIRMTGRSVQNLDTRSGCIAPAAFQQQGDAVTCDLELAPWGHALWLVGAGEVPPANPDRRSGRNLECHLTRVKRLRDNLLALDYCDIESRGREVRDVATVHANALNWNWQGFDTPPWRKHQFLNTISDAPVDPESELRVTYEFVVSGAGEPWSRSLRVGIERPWLYEMRVNGKPLPQESGERWFDEQMRAFPVGQLVQEGTNRLELRARPFRMLCEIAPAILIGDMSVEPQARGFTATAPRRLDLGDWSAQGLGFYHDAVRYHFAVEFPEAMEQLRVRLGDWAGALARVAFDGGPAGVILHPPYELTLDGAFAAGRHELIVDVVGNMKNRMGPHFSDGLAGVWSWNDCPRHMPSGCEYRFFPSGLRRLPTLEANVGIKQRAGMQ